MKKNHLHVSVLLFSLVGLTIHAKALTIEENEHTFLKKYSGQSKEFVTKNLGKPNKVDIAVKPKNADEVLREHQIEPTQEKKEIIEMWYYDAKINYAENKFFNQAELTFVNSKCVNITLANKKLK